MREKEGEREKRESEKEKGKREREREREMGRDIQEMLMGGPWLELSLSLLARAGNK